MWKSTNTIHIFVDFFSFIYFFSYKLWAKMPDANVLLSSDSERIFHAIRVFENGHKRVKFSYRQNSPVIAWTVLLSVITL